MSPSLSLSLSSFPLSELEKLVQVSRGRLLLVSFEQRAERRWFFSTRAGIELRDLCDRAAARIRNRFLLRRACVQLSQLAAWVQSSSAVYSLSLSKALAASLVCLCQCNSFLVHVWGQSGCYSFPLFTFGPKYKGQTQMGHSFFFFF